MTATSDLGRLLKQTMGLDIASIGASALERAVQERQRVCHVDDARGYLERVRASGSELQALVETIVIPETWFFRDREAFGALVRFVREEWLPTHADGCLRVLSLPCSTGEEPYSIAIALVEAHLPPSRFRVDAIDICGRSLEHAQRGVYRKSSFRGDDGSYRERFFESVAGGYALNTAVREQVHFRQGNLLDAKFLAGTAPYDVVFCRNMLIYFDAETQDRAVSIIEPLLLPDGLLLTGSSETGLFLNHGFSSAKVPMAFAFRKKRDIAKAKRPPAVPKARQLPPRFPVASGVVGLDRAQFHQRLPPQPAAEPDEALKLANQGHFAEASRCCEEYLRRNGPSAEAFHVLGLIRDALGNAGDAAVFYRKALYLDPGHQEALAHLALLMEKQGQKSEALALWNRAKRLAGSRPQ